MQDQRNTHVIKVFILKPEQIEKASSLKLTTVYVYKVEVGKLEFELFMKLGY